MNNPVDEEVMGFDLGEIDEEVIMGNIAVLSIWPEFYDETETESRLPDWDYLVGAFKMGNDDDEEPNVSVHKKRKMSETDESVQLKKARKEEAAQQEPTPKTETEESSNSSYVDHDPSADDDDDDDQVCDDLDELSDESFNRFMCDIAEKELLEINESSCLNLDDDIRPNYEHYGELHQTSYDDSFCHEIMFEVDGLHEIVDQVSIPEYNYQCKDEPCHGEQAACASRLVDQSQPSMEQEHHQILYDLEEALLSYEL